MMQQRRQEQAVADREEAQWTRRRSAELEDRDADANKVQYFGGNEDRVAFDPRTGSTRTLYDAPTPAQSYAGSLGYAPDTPQYQNALRDYVLRSSGPSAFDGRDALQDERLEASRRNNELRVRSSELKNIRSIRTQQRGQDLTDARTRGSATYQGRGRGSAGTNAPIATGPDGRKITVRNGRWVDVQTGQPVQ